MCSLLVLFYAFVKGQDVTSGFSVLLSLAGTYNGAATIIYGNILVVKSDSCAIVRNPFACRSWYTRQIYTIQDLFAKRFFYIFLIYMFIYILKRKEKTPSNVRQEGS